MIKTEPLELTIEEPLDVSVGETIQVYDVLRPDHRIDPIRVVDRDPTGQPYMLTVSAFGAIGPIALTPRSWRFDLDAFVFRRRVSPDARPVDARFTGLWGSQ